MPPFFEPQLIAEIVEQSKAEIPGLLRRQGIPGLVLAGGWLRGMLLKFVK